MGYLDVARFSGMLSDRQLGCSAKLYHQRCVRRVDVTGDELELILRTDGTAERDDLGNIIFVTPGGLYVPLEESSILRLTGRTLAQHTGGNEAGAGPAENSQVVAEVDMKSSTEGRWTHAAVLCLIETRKALEVKFGSARYKKKDVWKEVAAKINATCGLQFSSNQVETKWKNITKRYRDIVDHNRISGNERKSCPYFDELDEWYGHKSGVKPSTTASAGTASAATSTTSAADGSPAAECSSSTAPATVNTPTAATPRTSASKISPRKRKRSSMQTHMDYCLNNVLTAVKEMADNMQKMEQERLQLARQMHAEKMKFFGDFLEVLKGEKPDKQ